MLNLLFDFVAGFLAGRVVRNTAQIAQTATWTEEMKAAHQSALAERQAAQRALQERQRPLLYILLGFLAVIVLLGALIGGH